MKHLFFSVGIMLAVTWSFAQNDGANLEKYWKFRTDLREKFMKIGPLQGESLPAAALQPLDCVDNDPNDGSPLYNPTPYGQMMWGDEMIRFGHYLGLLATEYRLLKSGGQDVTGILNELYYALYAIDRLDGRAEFDQAPFYGFTLPEDENGFYLREDIPHNFAKNNWSTDPTRMACVNSPYYSNNNVLEVDAPPGLVVKLNTYQNTPSLDQMSSLMVGLSLVHKLVDDIYVKPKPTDQGFYLVAETKAIVHRMVSYASEHNWFLIDVNGWPVNNGGGDLLMMAAPLAIAGTHITGQPYDLSLARRPSSYHHLQACLTGYGVNAELTSAEQFAACANLTSLEQLTLDTYLAEGGDAGPFNNQDQSFFQTWELSGVPLTDGFNSASLLAWESIIPTGEPFLDQYLEQLGIIMDNTDGGAVAEFIGELEFASGNQTIQFNIGVAAGIWDPTQVYEWASHTENYELELIDGILKGYAPLRPSTFYRSFLDEMPLSGPYELKGTNWDGNPANIYTFTGYEPHGWASEYRWTYPDEAMGNHDGRQGIYNAIDYMLFHNLYWLAFNPGIQNTEFNGHCFCNAAIATPPPSGANSYQLAAIANLNQKEAFIPICEPSVLSPVSNTVTGTYTVQPKFADYADLSIFTTKYQLQNATVESGGALTVKTHLVLCDGALLNVKTGSEMAIEKSSTLVNYSGVLEVSGIVRVKAGAELNVRGKLRLKAGGKLVIEDGAKLLIDYAGSMEYYNGAEIITYGGGNIITLHGTIRTMDATTFSITPITTTGHSGRLIIGQQAAFAAEVPAYFRLGGVGITDPYIVVDQGTQLLIQDPEIRSFRIDNCMIELKTGASVKAEQTLYSLNANYYSVMNNGGVTVTDGNNFINCQFVHVPVKAMLTIENLSLFYATGCTFTASSMTLNPSDVALLKVTGMGLMLTDCIFSANRNYCVQSSGMVYPSQVANCHFSQYGSSGTTAVGISDVSTTELRSVSSSYVNCLTGIVKSTGKLSLKCNTFASNNFTNVTVQNGCLLNLSTSDLAGYNSLNKSQQNRSIVLSSAAINLRDGYNFIEQCTSTVSGTTSTACSGATCTLNFANNQWNAANTVPALSYFQLGSANLNYITPQVATVAPKPACGFYDGTIVIGPPKGKSTLDTDGMPIVWSAIENDSLRLDDAIVSGMELMTLYDSTGNDLAAVERFNEVYASDADLSNPLANQLFWFALDQMKSSLENAFAHGQLTRADNAADFEPHVAMYVNALMRLTAPEINETNYVTQFYHEIDKAHLLRVIGRSDIGLNILGGLEACGLDSAEQAELNYWKTAFAEDLVIAQIGMQALDSTIVIDTAGYVLPALAVNAYSFGAQLSGLNDISYPNCDFFVHRDLHYTNGDLSVFPNPAMAEVTVQWKRSEGESVLLFYQPDGRIAFTQVVPPGATELKLDVSNWKAGIYQVKLSKPGGTSPTAKLVVE